MKKLDNNTPETIQQLYDEMVEKRKQSQKTQDGNEGFFAKIIKMILGIYGEQDG